MSLHLVYSRRGLAACSARAQADDVVVLLGDGTYAAAGMAEFPIPTYHILQEDLTSRGLSANSDLCIDYADLVELCIQHNPIVSWSD